jgi:hypothetical protein
LPNGSTRRVQSSIDLAARYAHFTAFPAGEIVFRS